MRTAEGGEDQLAGVGLAGRDLEARAAFVDLADLVDVGEVEVRVDAVRVEVQGDDDDVEVAGAFAVAEERALDAVGAGEQGEFGGGDAGAAVVVRVQGNDRAVAARQVRAHPLDLVGVDVGRGVFDGGGEVEDDLVLNRWLPDVGDGLADLQGELEFGAGEAFRGIFEADISARGDQRGHVGFQEADGVGGDFDDRRFVGVENVAALGGRGGVVEMEDDVLRAAQGFERAGDQVLAALAEDLDGDVVGDAVFLDQAAAEIEFDLRCGREADLDFLEADADQQVEILEFFLDAHGLGEGLIAVAEVDAAPSRGAVERAVGPLAVGQIDGRERTVFANGS
jgi:hypothetical protein